MRTSGLLIIAILMSTAMVWAAPKIVILGDSLTEGYGVDKTEAFPYLVQQELQKKGFPGVEVINAGVSGSTSASAVSRLRWFLRVKPDILILALGGNDGLRGLSPQQMKNNLVETIELALKNKLTVILAGMQMPPNYGPEYTEAFKKVYPELAEHYQISLIPFLLEGVGGNPQMNQIDGIHPNEKGHQKIAQIVTHHLIPILDQFKSPIK